MTTLYRSAKLEAMLCDRLYAATRCDLRSPLTERRIEETAAILKSGRGSLFALAGAAADFSMARGYPVSFRGHAGSLLVSHLLGFVQNNPMKLGIPWQGAFSEAGTPPHITLNVAPEVYGDVRQHLKELATDCNVLWDVPGQPAYRVVFAPEPYDPAHRYLSLDILTHSLLSQVGNAARAAGRMPRRDRVLSPAFVQKVWAEDMWDTPILRDMAPLRDDAPELEPRSFSDLIRLLGLALAPPEWREQLDNEQGAAPGHMIATREDLYERLLQKGAPRREALAALRSERGLYPRAQCAEYLTYALVLAWFRDNGAA